MRQLLTRRLIHAERGPYFGQTEALDRPLLPRLALLMNGDTAILDGSIKARARDAELPDRLAPPDHRFLLHVPTVADVPIVSVVPDLVHLEQLEQEGGAPLAGRQGENFRGVTNQKDWARRGEAHHMWKGDNITVKSGRCRAQRMYDLGPCERCAEPAVDRHHKNGNTADNSRSNVEILCRRCHMTVDGRLDAFVALARKNSQPQPAKPCAICSKPYKPLRKGRCAACNEYRRRNGHDRPCNGGKGDAILLEIGA